ncbi:hypothetical protein K1719_026273 [Acacia pycnantha]|nr:hypothetical protein K1719_026273 [Acacia pycnantha]
MRPGAERTGSDMRRRNNKPSVRVTNLSEDTREPDLLELFRPFGDIFCARPQGRTIQASVLNNRNLLDKFRFSIVEGQIYKFANFEVTSNVNQYRATSHPFKITFTPRTSSAEDNATIPSYAYSFFPIPEIMKIDFRHPVDKLIDVVAFVKDVGTLDEFCRGNETKKRLRKVQNLIQSAKDEKSPIMVALSQPMTSQLKGCSEVKATVESVDAESVTPLVTPLDHNTISDLSQHVTPTPIKGKRRITNKRKGDKDDLTTTSHVFSAGPVEERVTKVIKQEK